ncbi:hypothetical protein [Streptomyces sp. SAS_276]|uniref:hypothetical protein n=1 Tax=Streptomyces sp. SAS_276 TaxID=3412745 RepID=UPI00403D4C96
MFHGVLIAESLRVGAQLTGIPLQITRLTRVEMTNRGDGQPRYWTLLELSAEGSAVQRLADQPASCLASSGGWYTDFHTQDGTFVIFANKFVLYPRGQAEDRSEAQHYGRSVGVPEPQLDWQVWPLAPRERSASRWPPCRAR